MMNSLFRIATRTLSLGLLVALSLVLIVTVKGIHPNVLVAFKPASEETQLAAEPESTSEPLQFAQAESNSRLDAPSSLRSAIGGDSTRPSPSRTRTPSTPTAEQPEATLEMPQLPPLPGGEQEAEFEDQGSSAPVEVLAPPSQNNIPNDFSDSATNPRTTAVANPLPGNAPDLKPNETVSSAEAELALRVSRLQTQLKTLTTEHEQQQRSQQSWMESAQLLQQQKLQGKLHQIEATLRELKAKSNRPETPAPALVAASPNAQAPTAPASPIIEEGRAGADGEKRFSIESQGGVKELLNALTQKANLNLILSINVEGDVELSLKNATADEAFRAIEKSTGYIVEKDGQKVYVSPGEPMRHQREGFLPPIIKAPSRTRAFR
ncbi:MAG: hypothetical protein V4719_17265 [Planctomycetota bacterium]